ncbi:MAG TPA: alanine racemase [Patescibacteria group bacterium]|nr:alanine racemase [Patescibacteria group bacterium]
MNESSAGLPPRTADPPGDSRQAWVEVSLDAISRNVRIIRERIGAGRRLLAVIKANAYGHGAVTVGRRLESDGIDLLGVAFPEEGLELRRAGISAPILVMGAASAHQLPAMIASRLIPTAYGLSFVAAIVAESNRTANPIRFHLKVDTGMGRLGVLPEELPEALTRVAQAGGRAVIDGVFTTLSSSDQPDDPHTAAQLGVFAAALDRIRQAGAQPSYTHAANSGGVIDHPPSWLDTVRPGIMLYGVRPSERSTQLGLHPALSFKGRLALVKSVPTGTPIGYGRSFITARRSLIGTVPAGYADGLSRRISPGGHALVRGRRAPYAGRISMDHFTLDLTDIPGASEGDEVVIIGRQDGDSISARQVAEWIGTIPYEVLCRIGPRVLRLTVGGS